MTKVTVKKRDGHIVEVLAVGHSGFGTEGDDLVCAAVSAVMQTALLGLMRVASIQVKFERDEEIGLLRITLPKLNKDDRHNADVILDTMTVGLADLTEGLSKYLGLEIKSV